MVVFLVLPLAAAVTAAVTFFLVHEAKKAPREPVASAPAAARPSSAHPPLEPAVLLQKLAGAEDLESRGDAAGAEAAFAAITETNPESDRGWGGYGRALLAERKFREAVAALDRACRLNVVQPRHFAARGAALRELNDLKHAIRDYRDAFALDQRNVRLSNAVLFIALEIGDADLFERARDKIRQDNPGAEARWIMALAASEIRTGTNETATAVFKRAIEVLPAADYQALAADRIFADKRSRNLIQAASETAPP